MNIHISLNYIDLSRQATANLHMHWSWFSQKLVVTCVINWQAGTKLIWHGEERDGFVTLNTAAIKKRYDGFKGISGLGQLHVFPKKCVEILQKLLILDSQINVQINVKVLKKKKNNNLKKKYIYIKKIKIKKVAVAHF